MQINYLDKIWSTYGEIILNNKVDICFAEAGNKLEYTFIVPAYLDTEVVVSYFDELKKVWKFNYDNIEKSKLIKYKFNRKKMVKSYWKITLPCPLQYKELIIIGNLIKGVNEYPEFLYNIYYSKGFSSSTLIKDLKIEYSKSYKSPHCIDHVPWNLLSEYKDRGSLRKLKYNLYNNCPAYSIWEHCLGV